LALELSRLMQKTLHFVFSSGRAFGFSIFCAEGICSSERFLGRVTNVYFCAVSILVLFSFNITEILGAAPDYSPLSLITSIDHLHLSFWRCWGEWKALERRVADGYAKAQCFLFSPLQLLHHPRPGLSL